MGARRHEREGAKRRSFALRFTYEHDWAARGASLIAGVDEVGRGPIAGPVVAAAVILPKVTPNERLWELDDSKRLSPTTRDRLAIIIKDVAVAWAINTATVAEIETLNIRQASFLAMRRAICALQPAPDAVLVDGFSIPGLPMPQQAIVGGDHLSNSIAAASVIAKVYRDSLMKALDTKYPGYGFGKHKGYGTPEHFAAVARLGMTPIHRSSFVHLEQHPDVFTAMTNERGVVDSARTQGGDSSCRSWNTLPTSHKGCAERDAADR